MTDAEWGFLLPYLTQMRADAPQRPPGLREVFNAVRYVVKTGSRWRKQRNDSQYQVLAGPWVGGGADSPATLARKAAAPD